MRWPVCLVALAGCGRIAFDGVAGGDATNAPGDGRADGSVPDGPQAACTTWGPWQTPRQLTELNTSREESGPTPRFDGLELVFAHSPAPGVETNLYHARRASTADPWGTPVELAALSTAAKEESPELSADGLTLYYASDAGGTRLWYATRGSVDEPFANPALLPGGPFTESGTPSLRGDELELFYADTFGVLYSARRASTAESFPQGTPLPAPVAAASWQEGPWISPDGTTLFWGQDTGEIQIFTATRPNVDAPFSAPELFMPLATSLAVFDPALSADGTMLLYTRWDITDRDLEVVTRECLP